MKLLLVSCPLLLASLPAAAAAAPCPAEVSATVGKLYPEARVTSCKPEKDNGKLQYEIRLAAAGKQLELDLTPAGVLLQTEEKVPMEAVPAAVRSAFGQKYPGRKALAAEKQVKADGTTTFEVGFLRLDAHHEATFTATGSFVEEE